LALPALLYEWENRAIREQDKYSLTSAEMKFIKITANYTFIQEMIRQHNNFFII